MSLYAPELVARRSKSHRGSIDALAASSAMSGASQTLPRPKEVAVDRNLSSSSLDTKRSPRAVRAYLILHRPSVSSTRRETRSMNQRFRVVFSLTERQARQGRERSPILCSTSVHRCVVALDVLLARTPCVPVCISRAAEGLPAGVDRPGARSQAMAVLVVVEQRGLQFRLGNVLRA
ncbi:hypothetical protein EXIGLDRAFT_845681 [Exidia glandulosa HHB12029]|uniref:Uncharacterized protein n=1 Tax=Exidia glandulosa HHB12029 TaxID=1314781 RepID=A0A165BC20_EXIGL|nr:hypothetical protein EXIGLDRAFT_845681 [Exidia glandulosa HHB12029]